MKAAKGRRDFRHWLRYQYVKLVRLNDSPEKVAGGLALGVVLGILPTFGLGVVLAVLIAGPLKVNRVSAIIGTLVMNPWTTPFFWALSYLAGSLVLGNNIHEALSSVKSIETQTGLWKDILTKRLLLPYIIGNVIVTAMAAASFYVAGLYFVKEYRKAKKKRLKAKAQKPA
jgi:uncharacterized protein (DUF2062 family)